MVEEFKCLNLPVWGKSPELGSPVAGKGEPKHASPELKEYTYKQEKVSPTLLRATGSHHAAETWVPLPAGPQTASAQI